MRIDPSITKRIGPGIVIAATGIGAGDLIAASVCGVHFGLDVLWAVMVGALIKFVLNEGIARWQLVKGSTVLEAWIRYFPKFIKYYFLAYLFIWSFIVGGALSAACGIAANSLFPFWSVPIWGAMHSLLAIVLVLLGSYQLIEKVMKWIIALMFVLIIYSAYLTEPNYWAIGKGLISFKFPADSHALILGVIGGIGGSLTLLSYGYWIREKKWRGKKFIQQSRLDLFIAYLLTALFGLAVMVLSAGLNLEKISGTALIMEMSNQIGRIGGEWAKYLFLIGFWGAVFSSMLGVWQGIPYLFNDFMLRYKHEKPGKKPSSKSKTYIYFLLFLAIAPLSLFFFSKPLWIIILYAIIGGLFLPFLASMLLAMNNRFRWLGKFRNRLWTNIVLVLSLCLFVYILIIELMPLF